MPRLLLLLLHQLTWSQLFCMNVCCVFAPHHPSQVSPKAIQVVAPNKCPSVRKLTELNIAAQFHATLVILLRPLPSAEEIVLFSEYVSLLSETFLETHRHTQKCVSMEIPNLIMLTKNCVNPSMQSIAADQEPLSFEVSLG